MSFPRYPKYKDSGVEWLGEVPDGWTIKAVRHTYNLVGGSTPKSDVQDYWDGDVVWITPADLSKLESFEIRVSMRTLTQEGLNSCGTTVVPVGSVILSTRAPIGSLGIAAVELCTNQGCKALVPSEGQNSRFFAYCLVASNEALNVRGKGTTFLELSGDELGSFRVPNPSSAEQQAIAAFLDRETAKIDALIAEQENLIALLKEKRQAVISHAVTKGLDPTMSMKDSGIEWLGEVPVHWNTLPIAKVSKKITNGYVGPTRDILVGTGTPYIQATHIKGGRINFDDSYFVTPEWSKAHAKSILAEEDVLIVQTGAGTGDIGLVSIKEVGFNCHALILITPDNLFIRGAYLSMVLRSSYGQQKLQSIQTGAMHPHLNCGEVKFVEIPLPPIDEQSAICGYVETETAKLDDLTTEAQHTIDLLKERRSALISAAVTGKIDVRRSISMDGA